jgi:signal peptidase I
MVDLHGSLASIQIGPLTRFLCTLGKSGDLLVSGAGWVGQLSLDGGALTAARIETESGADALRAIAATTIDGEFEFVEGRPTLAPNPDLGPEAMASLDSPRLDRAAWGGRVPTPSDVPRRALPADDEGGPVSLDRPTVHLLLQVDGRLNVRELSAREGVWRTLNGLARLWELGFIQLEPPPSGPTGPASRTEAVGSPSPTFAGLIERAKTRAAGLMRRASRIASTRPARIGFELAQAIVATAVVVLAVRAVVLNFRVEGISMHPTFESGEVLLVNRAAYFHVDWAPLSRVLPLQRQGNINYLFGGPRRGDVVVFDAPPQPGTDYIKRIIGLPGDTVSVDSGVVRVNGVPLHEPYIRVPANYRFPSSGTARVPDDSYFVLGDNRPDSFDSHFGWFVPVYDLIGEAWIRYWPPNTTAIVQGGAATVASVEASTNVQPDDASN